MYIYIYSIALHWRSKYHWRSRSGEGVRVLSLLEGCTVAPGPGVLTGHCPVKSACPWNYCLWGKIEGSGAGRRMHGAQAGIIFCLGSCRSPQVSFGVPFGSDCLAQGGNQNSARSWVPDLGIGDRGHPCSQSDRAESLRDLSTLVVI